MLRLRISSMRIAPDCKSIFREHLPESEDIPGE
jgi:hypothetical protein